MKIVEVNFSDLVGRAFNGFELHLELRRRGINAKQIVLDKRSCLDSVKQLRNDLVTQQQIRRFETSHSIRNLIVPYAAELERLEDYQEADIVHCHILHNGMISLFDYPQLLGGSSVWTIHDPWIVTGNCVHPLDCEKWKSGCKECGRLNEIYFEMAEDNTQFMWELKKQVLGCINPHIIVASEFMKRYLQESPLTQHFSNIHMIPFGIQTERYSVHDKEEIRKQLNIPEGRTVVGFRADDAPIKGCKILYDAFRMIYLKNKFYLLSVGAGQLPEDIRQTYQTVEYGWTDDIEEMARFYEACDIFVMPSLAESFGLMAVEAMAAKNTVVCFQGTVLEEITNAPECGVSVKAESAAALAEALGHLAVNPKEVEWRGMNGYKFVQRHYRFETYVDKHQALYERIIAQRVRESLFKSK